MKPEMVSAFANSDKPHVMAVPLQSLQAGTYTVHWRADGHTTHGEYIFQIK